MYPLYQKQTYFLSYCVRFWKECHHAIVQKRRRKIVENILYYYLRKNNKVWSGRYDFWNRCRWQTEFSFKWWRSNTNMLTIFSEFIARVLHYTNQDVVNQYSQSYWNIFSKPVCNVSPIQSVPYLLIFFVLAILFNDTHMQLFYESAQNMFRVTSEKGSAYLNI